MKSSSSWSLRNALHNALLLYAVTDRAWLQGRSLADCVIQAIQGGVTCVQLREKDLPFEEFLASAQELKELCAAYGVPFIVNDSVEIAREVEADGIHIGQDDLSCREARALLGEEKLVGVSVSTLEEALSAWKDGADYLGVGAVIATPTKTDARLVSSNELADICATVPLPVVAIGGLNAATIPQLEGSGVAGAAVVSALFSARDIAKQARVLRVIIEETVGKKGA